MEGRSRTKSYSRKSRYEIEKEASEKIFYETSSNLNKNTEPNAFINNFAMPIFSIPLFDFDKHAYQNNNLPLKTKEGDIPIESNESQSLYDEEHLSEGLLF